MNLSIITPTLNKANSLKLTIRSVLSQGFDNVQHLIFDGGSTDGTIELVRELAFSSQREM